MELQEGSFELQMKYYRELVASRPDMELVDVYGDKGKTGRSIAARPAFRRMLADCEAGCIDLILTKSISRFARNLGECIATLRRLKELGIPVLFEKEGLNSLDAQGELMLSIFAAIAQEESNSISQNMLWANERRNAAGQPHFRPSYVTPRRGASGNGISTRRRPPGFVWHSNWPSRRSATATSVKRSTPWSARKRRA